MPTSELEAKLRSYTAWLIASVVFGLALMFAAMTLMLYTSVSIAGNSAQTHDALCALKLDLEVRHTNGVKFLKDNPDGIPGISAEQIQQSLDNQQSTLDALASLDC